MMLKIVYGPPPADAERIEAAEPEEESCIREQEALTPVKDGEVGRKPDRI